MKKNSLFFIFINPNNSVCVKRYLYPPPTMAFPESAISASQNNSVYRKALSIPIFNMLFLALFEKCYNWSMSCIFNSFYLEALLKLCY